MSEILSITESTVKIGGPDGSIADLPIAAVQFPNPKVGDQVNVYKNDDAVFVRLANATPGAGAVATATGADLGDRRRINKVAYILIAFFLGALGIHRFMRGQVGLGIVMLLFWWVTLGIWPLVDFIISLVKLSAYEGDDYIFTADGRWAK